MRRPEGVELDRAGLPTNKQLGLGQALEDHAKTLLVDPDIDPSAGPRGHRVTGRVVADTDDSAQAQRARDSSHDAPLRADALDVSDQQAAEVHAQR